jgi:hypothetical protein
MKPITVAMMTARTSHCDQWSIASIATMDPTIARMIAIPS